MPLTRGEALGYDADLMAFKFTMKNGEQIVQCQISNAALGDLAGRWTGSAGNCGLNSRPSRDYRSCNVRTLFDQISNKETRLVRIFAKHFRRGAAPR